MRGIARLNIFDARAGRCADAFWSPQNVFWSHLSSRMGMITTSAVPAITRLLHAKVGAQNLTVSNEAMH